MSGRSRRRAGGGRRPARRASCYVHPTALVASTAELDTDVAIGPYALIGPHVRLGRGTTVGPHAVIEGHTTIGAENQIFQFAAIGAVTPDLKYRGEDSQLLIGDRNSIREFATLHAGTAGGGLVTRVGDGNLLMPYTHIAHDCTLGNHNILANGAQLGGHVTLQDYVNVSALAGVHQFSKIGESAIVGAGAMVAQDVAPFCNATGDRAVLYGLNLVGLRRRGFSEETIATIKRAYRMIFRSHLRLAEALEQARSELPGTPEIERFLRFIASSERGLCRPAPRRSGDSESPAE